MTLDRLRPCQCARITGLSGEEAFRARLRDLGLREGETVIMVKQAPLTDPVEYCVQRMHISLRRSEARCIHIEDVAEAPCMGPARRHRRWGWFRWGRGAGARCAPQERD